MTWSTNLPTDGTKLRIAPSQIRQNWQAIENGDVPYVYLRLAEQIVNPTRADDRGFLFAKDPGSGFTELYYQDSRNPANVIELTANGKMGSTSTQVLTSGVSFDDSYFYTASNFIAARATIGSGGSALQADGITSVRNSTGKYTISVAAGRLQTSSYQTIVVPFYQGSPVIAVVESEPNVNPASATDIQIRIYVSATATLSDNRFNVIVVGGR